MQKHGHIKGIYRVGELNLLARFSSDFRQHSAIAYGYVTATSPLPPSLLLLTAYRLRSSGTLLALGFTSHASARMVGYWWRWWDSNPHNPCSSRIATDTGRLATRPHLRRLPLEWQVVRVLFCGFGNGGNGCSLGNFLRALLSILRLDCRWRRFNHLSH